MRLIDYKSATHTDLPERYKRQMQLYAWLWHETYNDWPTEATVVYPFRAQFWSVDIAPAICEQVVFEAAEVIAQL